jgi:hypothetical protein
MKNQVYVIGVGAAGALAGTLLLLATRSPLLLPLPALLGVAGVLLAGWRAARRSIRDWLADPPRLTLVDTAPHGLEGEAGQYDRELQELGYHPAGFLVTDRFPNVQSAVYIHEEHAVYASLTIAPGRRARSLALTLESFFADGGRLTTTTDGTLSRVLTSADTGVPRLAQVRVRGRPLALDGQHLGTLKAWSLGRRQALPATPEALVGYIEADRERMREGARSNEWLPFSRFLRWIFGDPPGVLKF